MNSIFASTERVPYKTGRKDDVIARPFLRIAGTGL